MHTSVPHTCCHSFVCPFFATENVCVCFLIDKPHDIIKDELQTKIPCMELAVIVFICVRKAQI